MKKYEGLFGKERKKENETKDKFSDLNGRSKIDDAYNWHQLVFKLITELNTTEKKVYRMNYISSLNWLSYFKQRDEVANGKSVQQR
jgi:hypothetical protein